MRDGMHRFAFVAILISGGLVSAPCLAQGGGSKPKPPSPTPPPVTIQTPAVL